ncbi:MAG: hypothetical protein LAN36_11570 [Acidobacteriia bacterium]|nr:hypothetical protein [Terriglobia bacterium]
MAIDTIERGIAANLARQNANGSETKTTKPTQVLPPVISAAGPDVITNAPTRSSLPASLVLDTDLANSSRVYRSPQGVPVRSSIFRIPTPPAASGPIFVVQGGNPAPAPAPTPVPSNQQYITKQTWLNYRLSGFTLTFPPRTQGVTVTVAAGQAVIQGQFVNAGPVSLSIPDNTTVDFWLKPDGMYILQQFLSDQYADAPVYPQYLHVARAQSVGNSTIGASPLSNDVATQIVAVDNANYLDNFVELFWMKVSADYTAWAPSTFVNVGDLLVTSTGRIYQVSTSGTTGLTEPTDQYGPTPPNFLVIDGTAGEIFFGLSYYAQLFRWAKANALEWYFQNLGLARTCQFLTSYPISGTPTDLILPYIEQTIFHICHARQNNFAYQLGQKMFAKQSGNSFYWLCTAAGTSAGSSPFTGSYSVGSTVTDGGATFTAVYAYYGSGTDVDWVWLDLEQDWVTYTFPDSHDSFAATFLSLVAEYLKLTGNKAWLSTTSPQAGLTYAQVLAHIATQNLTTQLNVSGVNNNLVNTFQAQIFPKDGSVFNICYTEDNCEDYRGLIDGAYVFGVAGDATTQTACLTAAASVVTGIESLYGTSSQGNQFFTWAAGVTWDSIDTITNPNWYPNLQPNLFPELNGVPVTDAANTFATVRNWIAMKWPSYWADSSKDTFPNCFIPWMAAAVWQDVPKANDGLFIAEKYYSGNFSPGVVNAAATLLTCHEFGYFLATKARLAQPWQITSLDTTGLVAENGNGTVVRFFPSEITLETNGVANGSQALLNLEGAAPIAVSDDGLGNITFSSYGNVVPVAAVSATYQTTLADFLILASGSFTVTLLTSGVPVGQTYVVKNTGSGTITVVGQTGNIDGAASISLATQYQAATLTFDGANWWVS